MPADRENYYDDAPAAAGAKPGGDAEPKEGDEGGQTFIVPKSAFGGREIKPGDKCDIEVKAVHENDVECVPCQGHEDEENNEGDEPAPEPAPAASGGGMSSLME
jgi:hypothetical protein